MDWECAFSKNCEITFLVGGAWKSNVVLEKSLKIGCNFFMNPVLLPGDLNILSLLGLLWDLKSP